MAAGFSAGQLAEAGSIATEAQALRARVAPLGQADAVAYAAVLAALHRSKDDLGRAEAVRTALSEAADVPLAVAEAGVRVGVLAERLERDGNPNLRGDAATARLLAAAAVRAAATLVELNLRAGADSRVGRARELADEARF